MDLYLLRHGIAEEAKPGGDDESRALTAEGRVKLRSVLGLLAQAKVTPAVILSSELKRAVQTAEIAAKLLNYPGEIFRTKALVPGGSPEDVWNEVRAHRAEASLMLVGHNPLMTQLTSFLVASPALEVDFKKGALMKIGIEGFGSRPHGILRWFLTAKLAGKD